jgi:rhodanese-related sulfurtransferase
MTTALLNIAEKTKEFVADKVVTIRPPEVNRLLRNNITPIVVDVRDAENCIKGYIQLFREHFTSIIVDVREREDFIKGHVPGAINIPKGSWDKIGRCHNEEIVIIYCYSQTCHLAIEAALEFVWHGYSVLEMEGGFEAWKENKLPVEK